MDVHRARFIPHPTPSISCLAFTRISDSNIGPKKPALRLALARTDGSIEIWNPLNGIWTQEIIFPAAEDNAVDTLCWTQEPDEISHGGDIIVGEHRLFSVGSSANVIEWNLETGTIKRRSTGNFSEVWCLAAQPRSPKATTNEETTRAQDLVIGCGDGTLALLTTEDNDLQFKRFLARVSGKRARCLTVAYQKPEVVVAGFADSIIRVFDTRSGLIMRTMSLGAGLPGAPKTTLVWKLVCLANGDIASADSNGELRIWDGKTLSLSQRLNGHEGDCLDIVTGSDGKTLFSGGVDGRIACYRRSNIDRSRASWSKISHRKIHREHGPVKALAAYDGKTMSVLVAGGGEPAPVLAPLKAFGKENFRSLSFLPQQPKVVSSPIARLVATWWDKTIYIYKVSRPDSFEVLRDKDNATRHLVGKIRLSTKECIWSVALSPYGDLIAASTESSTKLFQLGTKSNESVVLKVRQIKLPRDIAQSGSKLVSMAGEEAEGAWLAIVTLNNEIRLTRVVWSSTQAGLLDAASSTIELDRAARRGHDDSGFKLYNKTINRLTFTEDGSTLVTGDLDGNLDYWEVEGDFNPDAKSVLTRELSGAKPSADDSEMEESSDDEDNGSVVLYGQMWNYGKANPLPRLDSAALVMTFRPHIEQKLMDSQLDEADSPTKQNLLVITARHQMYEFDLQQGRLSDWSRRNPSSSLPEEFTRIRDRVMGAHWDPKERLWLYGSSFVFMLDLSDNLSDETRINGLAKRKRHEGTEEQEERSKLFSKRSRGSGAGTRITNDRMIASGPHTAKRIEGHKTSNVDLDAPDAVGDGLEHDDDADGDEDNSIELDLNRTKTRQDGGDALQLQKSHGSGQAHKHWATFKYRPILGMVEVLHGSRSSSDAEDVLEVVIVERPPLLTSTTTTTATATTLRKRKKQQER